MSVNLHIDRLILDGLPLSPAQGKIVKAAVEKKLSRMLEDSGMRVELQTCGGCYAARTVGISPADGRDAVALGEQIAVAVYRGIIK